MPCPPNTISYIIRQGDTLFALAAQYNTTVPAIVSANPGIDPQRLTVGQEICIPQQAVYPPCPEGNYYTIRAGDTLYAIARQFNVSLDDLLEANPGIEPFQLQVGQVICIPVATPPVACPEGYTQHTVVAGDTFFALAQRYGVTVDALRAANPNVNPNALLIGQTLCIPPAEAAPCPEG
ncbi:MAG: LysM peptidoglycan-binding domain-containing protein, partial [Christensenellales bacterium]